MFRDSIGALCLKSKYSTLKDKIMYNGHVHTRLLTNYNNGHGLPSLIYLDDFYIDSSEF